MKQGYWRTSTVHLILLDKWSFTFIKQINNNLVYGNLTLTSLLGFELDEWTEVETLGFRYLKWYRQCSQSLLSHNCSYSLVLHSNNVCWADQIGKWILVFTFNMTLLWDSCSILQNLSILWSMTLISWRFTNYWLGTQRIDFGRSHYPLINHMPV